MGEDILCFLVGCHSNEGRDNRRMKWRRKRDSSSSSSLVFGLNGRPRSRERTTKANTEKLQSNNRSEQMHFYKWWKLKVLFVEMTSVLEIHGAIWLIWKAYFSFRSICPSLLIASNEDVPQSATNHRCWSNKQHWIRRSLYSTFNGHDQMHFKVSADLSSKQSSCFVWSLIAKANAPFW